MKGDGKVARFNAIQNDSKRFKGCRREASRRDQFWPNNDVNHSLCVSMIIPMSASRSDSMSSFGTKIRKNLRVPIPKMSLEGCVPTRNAMCSKNFKCFRHAWLIQRVPLNANDTDVMSKETKQMIQRGQQKISKTNHCDFTNVTNDDVQGSKRFERLPTVQMWHLNVLSESCFLLTFL